MEDPDSEPVCPECGTKLAPGQEWCVECGAGPLGGPPPHRARALALVAAGAVALAVGAAVAALAASDGASDSLAAAPAATRTVVRTVRPDAPDERTITARIPAGTTAPRSIAAPPPITAATPPPPPAPGLTTETIGETTATDTTDTTATGTATQTVPTTTVETIPDTTTVTTPRTTATTTATTARPTGELVAPGLYAMPLPLSAATLYDPYHEETAAPDPTQTLDDTPHSAMTVTGVDPAAQIRLGVDYDLGSTTTVKGVRIHTITPGFTVEIYGASGPRPADVTSSAWHHLATVTDFGAHAGDSGTQIVALEGGYRHILLWFTTPPTPAATTTTQTETAPLPTISITDVKVLH